MKTLSKAAISLTLMTAFACAQTHTPTTPAATVVPRLVSFSGIVRGGSGKPLSGQVSITFALYEEQQGGSPLWSEMQAVQADEEGRYSVFLGAANGTGLPLEVFTSGAARWLAVRPDVPGIEDPARILLVGVPYALKAADADTLGGRPASAYVTTESQLPAAVVTQEAVATPVSHAMTALTNPTGTGTTDYIPIWTNSTTLGNSVLYQSGNNVGIGTTTPGSPLTLLSNGNTFPAGVSYLADFIGSGSGNSAGTSNYRGLDFEITATGSTAMTGFTSITGDNYNSLTTGTLGTQSIFSGNLRMNSAGNTTAGYGFQAIPLLSSTGGMTSWEAFDARTPSVASGGAGIKTAYGMYVEPQKVTGVTTGYGVYQGGSSDINYLAGKVGIGTKTPGANLEVSGTAKFDGAVTFAGGQTDTGNVTASGALISTVAQGTAPLQVTSNTQVANLNATYVGGLTAGAFAQIAAANTFVATQSITGSLNVSGLINATLSLQDNVTDSSSGYTSANVIAGYNGISVNAVKSGVTGAAIGGGGTSQVQGDVTYAYPNYVVDDLGTVSGGAGNTAGKGDGTGQFATVVGGFSNTASGIEATVAGGSGNTASGGLSFVGAGSGNTAGGASSFVAGGALNSASGSYSFAGGYHANATDNDSFVWCSAINVTCASQGTNSFVVEAFGNISFIVGSSNSGCFLSPSSASWSCSSDRNLKDHIQSIDPQSVLEGVAHMPISQWSMKSDSSSRKHIGPMAQDFYAAFGLGETDRYIAQGDAQGVALASIKGLYELVQQKDEKIKSLEERLQVLEKLVLGK